MPEEEMRQIRSLSDLVAMTEQYPDGFVVFFRFGEEGPKRAEIMRRDSTFHRLPDAVYGSIKLSSDGEVVSPIVFTETLFTNTKGFFLTAMTFEEENRRVTAILGAIA